jgi:cobalamin-dependent methionine synthase I
LRNAAIIGGVAAVAHHAGTKSAQEQAAEDEQNRRLAELQAQQAQPQYAAPQQYAAPAAPAITTSVVDQLTNLKQLLDSGVLSQAEFDAQKQRILNGS